MLFDQQDELFELSVSKTSFSVRVSAPAAQHETSARFVQVLEWYFSYHLSYSFVVSSAKILESVRALSFSASSVGVRFSLGSDATACSSFSKVPSIIPTKHVSAKSQSLYLSSAPLNAVGLFSRATSFAIVNVLTAPAVD